MAARTAEACALCGALDGAPDGATFAVACSCGTRHPGGGEGVLHLAPADAGTWRDDGALALGWLARARLVAPDDGPDDWVVGRMAAAPELRVDAHGSVTFAIDLVATPFGLVRGVVGIVVPGYPDDDLVPVELGLEVPWTVALAFGAGELTPVEAYPDVTIRGGFAALECVEVLCGALDRAAPLAATRPDRPD